MRYFGLGGIVQPGKNAALRAPLPASPLHCQAAAKRRLPKLEFGATSAGPIFLVPGLIHPVAASFSENL